ncbi:ArnT family glycosyltransferase [Aurantibacillus circumpalustris]|uniref:ArnT family glycosyltransferase n=1 Tax=Aurantibacillus circumpalustris TaxID=3036359 RepID=UPI00295B1811|nr:glycosyltransferase family 39 protein [Aurantibacillus circumpalustris]
MAKIATGNKTQKTSTNLLSTSSFKIAGRTFSFTQEEKICSILMTILILLIYSIRSKFLLIPFERDEGIYSYMGKLALEGKTPYIDFYEMKFPGLFYFYASIVGLFGDTVKGMHTGFMYLNIATILLLYNAGKNLFSPIAGLISAITFAFVSLTANLSGFTVQAEHGVAFFISLGLFFYTLTKKSGKWYYFLSMGVALGMAFMVKTSGVFMPLWGGLILILDLIFSKKPRQFKTFFKNLLAYSVGGFSVIAIFFTVIFFKGSFNEMIYWTYEYSKVYVGGVPFEEGIKYFKYTRDAIVQNYKFFWVHSVLAVAVCLLRPISFQLKAFGISLLIFSGLTIVPGFYFYGHYWIQTLPGISLLAGLTYHCIITVFEPKLKLGKLKLRYIYLSVFAVLTYNHINALKSYYFHPNYDLILRQVYGSNPFPEAMEIGNFINANSKPEDNIVLIGSEPQIYFYTKKKSPSRHAYFTALVSNVKTHKEWQREFVRDTEKAKPRYVIFFNNPISLMVQPNTDNYVFEWANKYITENYTLIGFVDMVDGYTNSNYVWREQIATYKQQGKNSILIYERKSL